MQEHLIQAALEKPSQAIAYTVSRHLAAAFPDRALLEGDESHFGVEQFALDGHCELRAKPGIHTHWESSYDPDGTLRAIANGWYEVTWEGHALDVLEMQWTEGWHRKSYHWLLGESPEIVDAFFQAVCRWNAEVRGEVLVFAGGCWFKDRELFQVIQSATLDNLILAGDLKEELRSDLQRFFDSRATYEKYGVPWKRGILLIGPPGNGKTHAVKAIINTTRRPCLYVKSFKAQHSTDHDSIRQVFHRARESAPCLLVLEDLDSLVDAGNRSYFLNELDGFAANTGIVTLATTNYPERLDASILERPSRFDRKYHFLLPAAPERRAYLALWNGQLQPEMRLGDDALEQAVRLTEGYSFAYLKELMLSSMMRWINDPAPGAMGGYVAAQAVALGDQMRSGIAAVPEVSGADFPLDYENLAE